MIPSASGSAGARSWAIPESEGSASVLRVELGAQACDVVERPFGLFKIDFVRGHRALGATGLGASAAAAAGASALAVAGGRYQVAHRRHLLLRNYYAAERLLSPPSPASFCGSARTARHVCGGFGGCDVTLHGNRNVYSQLTGLNLRESGSGAALMIQTTQQAYARQCWCVGGAGTTRRPRSLQNRVTPQPQSHLPQQSRTSRSHNSDSGRPKGRRNILLHMQRGKALEIAT